MGKPSGCMGWAEQAKSAMNKHSTADFGTMQIHH